MHIKYFVKLELLRHGEPHNQLLSPTTQYLGLSGSHEAGTVHVPYEHRHFMTRLKALCYSEDYAPEIRKALLSEMSCTMGNIFEAVPGLMADLSARQCSNDGLIHLRLIFSAAELAMLPFELINAPKGFPGQGSPLSLQFDSPLVMTREVRGAKGSCLRWDRKPKILFAAAAPGGVGTVPFRAHLHALRLAIQPWLKPNEEEQKETARIKEFITILPQASLKDIRRECKTGSYTHIHILAHGIPLKDKEKERYGLALCGSPGQEDPIDIVDGDRLALALRGHKADLQDGFSSPLVVTVVSCDSGKHGSVMWPGSSLAHTLHEVGIPFVVASQFPLSKRGSIIMAQELYKDLLWGLDPRVALHNLRQNLRSDEDMNHDWACVVAYASLPADAELETQLRRLKTLQAKKAMITALSRTYYLAEKRNHNTGKSQDFEKAIKELDRAIKWSPASNIAVDIEFLEQKDEISQIIAMVGTAQKRKAQALFELSTQREPENRSMSEKKLAQQAKLQAKAFGDRSIEALQAALQFYKRAFIVKETNHWAGVQYLSVAMCLDFFLRKNHIVDSSIWEQSRLAAQDDLNPRCPDRTKAFAHGSLTELYFLSMNTDWPEKKTGEEVVQQAQRIVPLVGEKDVVVLSTYWQFKRYTTWLRLGKQMEDVAQEVIECLRNK